MRLKTLRTLENLTDDLIEDPDRGKVISYLRRLILDRLKRRLLSGEKAPGEARREVAVSKKDRVCISCGSDCPAGDLVLCISGTMQGERFLRNVHFCINCGHEIKNYRGFRAPKNTTTRTGE